ncbi:MAG TPA: nucleoside phosphorylase [Acetobacteraceae bacterium]
MHDKRPAAARPPILDAKHHAAPAVFRPENLLREARRQRGLANQPVPEVCILDPDGDIVRALRRDGRGQPFPGWACYHSEMLTFDLPRGGVSEQVGMVGCAVGAPYAVLVAEQMFASGCRLLVSVTSAGRISANLPDGACFVLIDRALRDEGTSYHYLPDQTPFIDAAAPLADLGFRALSACGLTVSRGATWTTDAPFRETAEAIAWAEAYGVLAVEMEAAALYAFARVRGAAVLCLAHVTNRMAQVEGDFEKGEADGAYDALRAITVVVDAWRSASSQMKV